MPGRALPLFPRLLVAGVLLLRLAAPQSAPSAPPSAPPSTDAASCRRDLGMYSEEIDDSQLSSSSSHNHRTTGPQNARIRTDENGGAWCPAGVVSRDAYEWLQVDLRNLTVLTYVETQGRYGQGVGQEFAPHYRLEYQRVPGGPWITFKNRSGSELLEGNSNTDFAVLRELRPPVIARSLRFVPYSEYPRAVCMRVELYGCVWSDGTESYTVRQGDTRGTEVDFFDYTYDGVLDQGVLSGGLGQLIDFEEGDTNFRHGSYDIGKRGFEWVGWRNDTPNTGSVELTFTFDTVRNFSSLRIHAHNYFSKDVRVFRQARVYFSVGGEYYTQPPVVYDHPRDDVLEAARYVTIAVPHLIGQFVKVQLYYADRWILLSEVRFENEVAVGGPFEREVKPPPTTTAPIVLGVVKTKSDGAPNQVPAEHAESDHTYMAVLVGALGVVLVLTVVVVVALVVRRRHCKSTKYTGSGSPLKMFIGHDHVNFHMSDVSSQHGKVNIGNVYKGVASDDSSDSYVKDNSLTKLTSSRHDAHAGYRTQGTEETAIQCRKLPELPNGSAASEGCQGEYACTDISNYPNLVVSLPPTLKSASAAVGYSATAQPREDSPPPPPPHPQPQAMCAAMGALLDQNIQGLVGNSVYAMPEPFLDETAEYAVMDFPRNNLRFREKLGQGMFGEVYLCEALGIPDYLGDDFLLNRTANSHSILVAVKSLRPDACPQARKDFRKEVQILSRLRDPAIVRVLGASVTESPLLAVVEYMRHGDLNNFLKQRVPEATAPQQQASKQPYLTYGSLICMATQIASGMKYLESLNMVHRDLATRNCLVGNHFQVKISDFGMSRSLYSRDYYRIEGCAVLPIRWMSWESVLLGKFSTRSDVWSFAVTLWEILTFARHQPFDTLTDDQVIENCGHYYRLDGKEVALACPALCPREIYDLMLECWNRDELQRPSFREIHMFLQRKNMGYNPRDDEQAAMI